MRLDIFTFRLAVALLLGAVIGLERQWRHRMAGTRTNALVAAASAAFIMIGALVSGDPTASARIAGQIVTGIGFLGAGVIFREGASVRGLNTAATVWCSAAVGALAGMGYPQFSLVTAAAVVLTNVTLRPLAYKLHPELNARETVYHFELVCSIQEEPHVRALLLNSLDRNHVILDALTRQETDEPNKVLVRAELRSPQRKDECMEDMVTRLSLDAAVTAVKWRVNPDSAA